MRLQEVVWCLTSHMRFPTSWSWVKLQEGILEGVVKLHDGSLVSTAVAVVGGGEDGDHVPVVRPVVPLHDQLVGPGHICSGDKFWEYFPLPTQHTWRWVWGHLNGWKSQRCPGQKCNLRLEEKFPNHPWNTRWISDIFTRLNRAIFFRGKVVK